MPQSIQEGDGEWSHFAALLLSLRPPAKRRRRGFITAWVKLNAQHEDISSKRGSYDVGCRFFSDKRTDLPYPKRAIDNTCFGSSSATKNWAVC